jgi:cell division transport system permease protein
MRPLRLAAEVVTGLRRNLAVTCAVAATVAICLALLGVGVLLRIEVHTIDRTVLGRIEVVVDLTDDLGAADRGALMADMRADPLVAGVTYENRRQAYERFRRDFRNSPDVVAGVSADELPETLRVRLLDPRRVADFAAGYQDREGVADVRDHRALLRPLFRVLSGFQLAAFSIAAVQAAAALALVSTMIQMSARSRRRETAVMRLVGATSRAIRLPFVMESAAAGLAGGLAAAGVLVALKVYLVDHRLARQPAVPMFGWASVWAVAAAMVAVGVLLASGVAAATLRRHLRV